MKFEAKQLLLYAVTDRRWTGEKTLYQQVEEALEGGVTFVQLREKELDQEHFAQEARQLKELCHKYNVPFIINDNVEIALEVGADGVHVGLEDRPVSEIRALAGPDFIIGATTKTVEQAQEAQRQGADYLGIGAVFPSSTKTNALRITNEQLRIIRSSVKIPAVAIGGLTLENMDEVAGSGVDGVALVSAIFGAQDICEASRALKKKALEVTRK